MKRHTPPPSKRAANPLWDAVVAAFQLRPVTTSDRSRVGRIVRDLGMKGATPDDVTLRLDRYRARWPDAAPTPEALLKHWDAFAAGNGYDNNPLHVHVEPDDADILAAAEDHARMEREAAARRNGES